MMVKINDSDTVGGITIIILCAAALILPIPFLNFDKIPLIIVFLLFFITPFILIPVFKSVRKWNEEVNAKLKITNMMMLNADLYLRIIILSSFLGSMMTLGIFVYKLFK